MLLLGNCGQCCLGGFVSFELGIVSITPLLFVRFADAYNFLICLPSESHIWCGFWDIMGPLLETFYNYFKDDRQDSPLRCLWKRISDEMRHCLQCISQHHQAQEMYNMEYESSSIGPLLDVLHKLDNERVTLHLRDINTKLAGEEYDPAHDNAEVVNVLYEVCFLLLSSVPSSEAVYLIQYNIFYLLEIWNCIL